MPVNRMNIAEHWLKFSKNLTDERIEEELTKYSQFLANLTVMDEDGNASDWYGPHNDLNCYPFDGVLEVNHTYYLPCLILIGLIGNILSCVVFLTTHLRMRSSSYYLAALACADLGFLLALFLVWLSGAVDVPIFHVNGFCQCIVYLSSVCGFLSVWLIVAFTVERFIAVQYPLHRPHMCTVARAKAIIAYLAGFALVSHSYVFVTSGIIHLEDGVQMCEMLEHHKDTMHIINIIDTFLTLIIPLVLIVVMNVMIAVNLFRFSQRFKRHDADTSFRETSEFNLEPIPPTSRSSSNNNNNNNNSSNNRRNPSQHSFHSSRSNNSFCQVPSFHMKMRSCDLAVPNTRCIQIGNNAGKGLISTKTQYSITKMLLLVSSVFILLNLPSYVIRLFVFVFTWIWSERPPDQLWCAQQMFMSLYYTNFSVNFLLYSMYGITFRRCLWQLIRNKIKWISRYSCRQRM